MSEIEIGEYVRTKKGDITKIKKYYTETNLYECENGIFIDTENNIGLHISDIVNHSKNQKELIREGDILEYQTNKLSFTKIGKVKKYKDARTFKEYLGVEGFNLDQITILRILTKEKFEEESYKVGD